MFCPNCKEKLELIGFTADGLQIYICKNCNKEWYIQEKKE